jgi:hypothetical protein
MDFIKNAACIGGISVLNTPFGVFEKMLRTGIYRARKTIAVRLLLVLALLVSNAAGSLASRLAGGLALAASALLCSLAKILCLKCFNTLHKYILR